MPRKKEREKGREGKKESVGVGDGPRRVGRPTKKRESDGDNNEKEDEMRSPGLSRGRGSLTRQNINVVITSPDELHGFSPGTEAMQDQQNFTGTLRNIK